MNASYEAINLINTLESVNLSQNLNHTPLVTFGYIMQVLFSLLIVLGLIYITSKYLLPKLQIKSKGTLLEVEDRIGLEPQVSAYVLRAESRRWLVVVSSKNVAVIDELKGS
jgi:hypothetical protein